MESNFLNSPLEEYIKNLLILNTGLRREEIKYIKEVSPDKFVAICKPEAPAEKIMIGFRLEKEENE